MDTSPVSKLETELVLRMVRRFRTITLRTLIENSRKVYGLTTLDVCVAVDELEAEGMLATHGSQHGQVVSLPW